MKPQALERAEAAVATNEPMDITKLSGTRLGLAVVGALARKHWLHVFFRPSSRGGTGVVVRIPSQLIVQPRWDSFPTAPQPAVLEPVAVGTSTENGTPVGETELPALPKRPRGQTLAAATRTVDTGPAAEAPRPRPDMAARFSAFHQVGRTDKPEATDTPDSNGPSEDESR